MTVDMLHAYAVNCDNLSLLEDLISDIVSKMANLGLTDYHYTTVEQCLIEAMRCVYTVSSRVLSYLCL